MRVLIAEDDPVHQGLLETVLRKAGFDIALVRDGKQAMAMLDDGDEFDLIVTDWMMPQVDGLELLRRLRSGPTSAPVLVVSSMTETEAQLYAMRSGADAFLIKPFYPQDLLEKVRDLLKVRETVAAKLAILANLKKETPAGGALPPVPESERSKLLLPVAIGLTASTGGPDALLEVAQSLGKLEGGIGLIVLHGPDWMLQTFHRRLAKVSNARVVLAENGMETRAGTLYVCPGDVHLEIVDKGKTIRLSHGPAENFVRPSADPLFRSMAHVYGSSCIGAVLTGMGKDGAVGMMALHAAGARLVVQDPTTCIAPSMPKATLRAVKQCATVPLAQLGLHLQKEFSDLIRLAAKT